MVEKPKTDSAMSGLRRIRERMPKPKIYTEDLFIRAPEGTKAKIRRLSNNELQADFMRRLVLSALQDYEAGVWSPSIPAKLRKTPRKKEPE